MNYGIYYNKYEDEIYIYKIYDDGSRIKIAKLYGKNNYIHLDVTSNNFKHFIAFNEFSKIMERDMSGVNLKLLYNDLLEAGVREVYE